MGISLDDEQQLALARFRVALADIAPEIPETEVNYHTHLRTELGLDTVSIWAIATQLERLAKVDLNDDLICQATHVSELCEAIKTPVPSDLDPSTNTGKQVKSSSSEVQSGHPSQPEEDSRLASATDLRALFDAK